MTTERITFLKEFLRRPRELGTLIPSSSFLEKRLLRLGDVAGARVVVELGPGAGGTTDAILGALPQDGSLLAIELNSRLAAQLRLKTDPRLMVHRGSAEDMDSAIRNFELPAPDVVISGIPFSSIAPKVGRRILESIWNCLAPGGRFVAYQFRRDIERLGSGLLKDPVVEFEPLNVPPLRIYRWSKSQAAISRGRSRPAMQKAD